MRAGHGLDLSALRGRWLVFVGDSTHRQMCSDFVSTLRDAGIPIDGGSFPTIDGAPIFDNDHHKDTDAFGRDGTYVSLRFLRGLDLTKLELHTRDWRQRFFYPDMASDPPKSLLPLTLRSVFETDPLCRYNARACDALANRTSPDVIIFHSCAWDLPLLNRSGVHFPLMEPGRPCEPAPEWGSVRMPTLARRKDAAKVAIPDMPRYQRARVAASPCIRRGDQMSDDQIFDGFTARLQAAIALIRSRFAGRLVLRNCHAGTDTSVGADGINPRSKQAAAAETVKQKELERLNLIIATLAREEGVEPMDVFSIDRELGFHRQAPNRSADRFHVPQDASSAAALVLMWQLLHPCGQLPSNTSYAATKAAVEQLRPKRGAPKLTKRHGAGSTR